ncbi:MAG: hypothetical protein NC331_05270 [Lachnospiraceae bacterium]|nr:hypothetical protein [Lachnospiraceae bacterium]MCM1238777.1 hypothetical protein [Lachnospiraceae bacterium]
MEQIKKNEIMINSPRIVKSEGYMRLEADTVWNFADEKIEKTLFFEVEEKWGQYLTAESSDPFVLALLELAMEKQCDIRYEEPMSEDLKYQLETYMIPILSSELKEYYNIKLNGKTTREVIKSEMVVGTGFSGGVDSFYTVLAHKDIPYESKRVTHLLLALSGAAMAGMTEELDAKWYNEEVKRFRPLAEEMGLQFVGVNSNVSLLNLYRKIQRGADLVVTASFVYALRKLFGVYYWAAAEKASVGKEDDADGRIKAPLAISLVGSDGLKFYLSGCEVSRVEKVEYIANDSVAQKGLTVCGEVDNCGHCSKCLRTMSELYAIGKLDKFGAVFDVEDYKKHFSTKLARELALDYSFYTSEIIKSMKEHGIHIPISVYLKKNLYFKMYYFLKRKLKNNRFLMDLYYNHGWDQRLGEGRHSKELIDARMKGLS